MNPPVVIDPPGRRAAFGGTSPLGRDCPTPRSGAALAAVLALSIALPLPRTARASETEVPTTETGLETDVPPPSSPIVWSTANATAWQNRIGLGLDTPALRLPASAGVGLTASSPGREIRLSSGAKTAIIITAIVVGVLIIVGVVAIGKPHRHF
jgi:hypothetical protein